MLEEIELYVFDKYIKEKIINENGKKKIAKDYLEKLELTPQEKNFIMHIIKKQNIEVTEEQITKNDRSPYVRDNNYGDIKANDLQKIDKPIMSTIEYSKANDKVFEDYIELDKYLETRFIPTYVTFKRRKNAKGEMEQFLSIRLHHIMALKLSEAELEHVMNYLKENNIRVGGKGATLDGEFENYDYVTTYKESALPLAVPADETLYKISMYKQNHNQKLREEILTDNMRLVPYVAYRYAIDTKIDQHELESYGYEGLILALEKFDLSCGCVFSTYAIACIRGYILQGIQEILLGKRDNFYYDYVNAKNAVEKVRGVSISEDPDLVEDVIDLLVATEKINWRDEAREYARRRINQLAIGNASLNDDDVVEKLTTSGQLVDTHDYAEEVLNAISREELENVLDTLTPKEAEVLRLRFGFYDGIPKTLEEAGQVFHVTKERVRQIEAKALRKLRYSLENGNLADPGDFETEKYGNDRGKI